MENSLIFSNIQFGMGKNYQVITQEINLKSNHCGTCLVLLQVNLDRWEARVGKGRQEGWRVTFG